MKFALLEISMFLFRQFLVIFISPMYVRFEETIMSVLLPAFHFEKTNDIDWLWVSRFLLMSEARRQMVRKLL